MPKKQNSLKFTDYRVAIICCLRPELMVIESMLDEVHESPQQSPTDHNLYTWGSIGSHNIIVAQMPGLGESSAATIATLITNFPHLEFGLLLGTGSWMPEGTENENVRLGDVVTSGKHSEALQYDHWKTGTGHIGPASIIPPSSAVVLDRVQDLAAELARLRNKLAVKAIWLDMDYGGFRNYPINLSRSSVETARDHTAPDKSIEKHQSPPESQGLSIQPPIVPWDPRPHLPTFQKPEKRRNQPMLKDLGERRHFLVTGLTIASGAGAAFVMSRYRPQAVVDTGSDANMISASVIGTIARLLTQAEREDPELTSAGTSNTIGALMQLDGANPSAPVFLVACFGYTIALARLANHSQRHAIHQDWLLLAGAFAGVALGIPNLKAHEPRELVLLKYAPWTILLAAAISFLFALVRGCGMDLRGWVRVPPSVLIADGKRPLGDKDCMLDVE